MTQKDFDTYKVPDLLKPFIRSKEFQLEPEMILNEKSRKAMLLLCGNTMTPARMAILLDCKKTDLRYFLTQLWQSFYDELTSTYNLSSQAGQIRRQQNDLASRIAKDLGITQKRVIKAMGTPLTSIQDIKMSPKQRRHLRSIGIHYIENIKLSDIRKLNKIKGYGHKSAVELEKILVNLSINPT